MFRSISNKIGKREKDIIFKSNQLDRVKDIVSEFVEELGFGLDDLNYRIEESDLIIGSKNGPLLNEVSLRRGSLGSKLRSLNLNLKLGTRG